MSGHLRPAAAALLDHPTQTRILDRWPQLFIELDQVSTVVSALEDLTRQPDQERQMNLLVHGESNVGKSATLQYFVDRRMEQVRKTKPLLDTEYANLPTFRVTVPVRSEADFYVRILAALGRKDRLTRSVHLLANDTVRLMQACGVRLPIFDEFHNSSPDDDGIRWFAATLKDVGNTIRRPMVFGGTEKALRIIEKDPELSTRYFDIEMERFFSPGTPFQEMLYNFECLIPLARPSNLYDDPLCGLLFRLSNGLIGHVSNILRLAAARAADNGEERITSDTILSLDLVKTLQRQARKRS